MVQLDWLIFDGGRARFVGPDLGADEEPHLVLAAELGTDGIYFGDFCAKYDPDRTHYNVEIISFGYNSKYNVGNPHPGARAAFTASEVKSIRGLISALILADGDKPYPLNRRDQFLGKVSFRDGWIRGDRARRALPVLSALHRLLYFVARRLRPKTGIGPFRDDR